MLTEVASYCHGKERESVLLEKILAYSRLRIPTITSRFHKEQIILQTNTHKIKADQEK